MCIGFIIIVNSLLTFLYYTFKGYLAQKSGSLEKKDLFFISKLEIIFLKVVGSSTIGTFVDSVHETICHLAALFQSQCLLSELLLWNDLVLKYLCHSALFSVLLGLYFLLFQLALHSLLFFLWEIQASSFICFYSITLQGFPFSLNQKPWS